MNEILAHPTWLLTVLADPPWLLKAYTAAAIVFTLNEIRLRFRRSEFNAAKSGWLALSLFRLFSVALLWVVVGGLLYYSLVKQPIYMQAIGGAVALVVVFANLRYMGGSENRVRNSPPQGRLLWPIFAVFSIVVAYTEVYHWILALHVLAGHRRYPCSGFSRAARRSVGRGAILYQRHQRLQPIGFGGGLVGA